MRIRYIALLYRFAKIGGTECSPDIGFVIAFFSADAYRFVREQRRMKTSKCKYSLVLRLVALILLTSQFGKIWLYYGTASIELSEFIFLNMLYIHVDS